MKLLIEHANITVASIDEAKAFLGLAFPDFRERGRGYLQGGEEAGEWMHFGNDETYLALQQNRQHSDRRDSTYENDGINHLGFVTDNLDELLERMEEAGYKPSDASVLDGHPFRRRAYLFDKNGFEWEFVEYLSDRPEERNEY